MAKDGRDVVELMQQELAFIERGGYSRSIRTPWLPKSIFQDSGSCLNYGYPYRAHPCCECHLLDYVPPEYHSETVPCHFIPLTRAGETVEELEDNGNEARAQKLVRQWLRTQIDQLQKKRYREFWRNVDTAFGE